MDILNNLTSNKPLSSLQRPDIIEYQSDYINRDIFVVYSTDRDDNIPALMVQLWKFSGGYNHGVYSIVVNDLAVNSSVPILKPIIYVAQVKCIINYRSNYQPLTEKEVFIMDLKPDILKVHPDDEFSIPYQCSVILENGEEIDVNVPEWTPLQKLPINRIKVGSFIEIWTVNNRSQMMRVIKI